MGKWRYSSTILDLGNRWEWVVSFTLQPLYPRGNRPRYPLARRVGGPQSRFGRFGDESSLTPAGNWTLVAQPVSRRCTDWDMDTIKSRKLKTFRVKINYSNYDTHLSNFTIDIWAVSQTIHVREGPVCAGSWLHTNALFFPSLCDTPTLNPVVLATRFPRKGLRSQQITFITVHTLSLPTQRSVASGYVASRSSAVGISA
jgi:hypothetical protein